MKKLSRKNFPELPSFPEKVIQFGEGNFMRAFIDWQLQQMNNHDLFGGSAVVVQPIAQGLSELLLQQDNLYTLMLDGILNGEVINSKEIITTVDRVINPYTQYDNYLALAEEDALKFIISNTTEAGIQYHAKDTLQDAPQASFPGKLTALLYKRYQLNKSGFTIIPCELIDRNGEKLKEIVLRYAKEWQLEADFILWLQNENTFCCSLVDRIVPGYPREEAGALQEKLGYEDAVMVKAEPFLLWVIEGPKWLEKELPLAKAGLNVIVTNDMTPYRERKVHLLNGPHTAMVSLGLLAGLETVEDVMSDSDFAAFVDELMKSEIIPTLDLPAAELRSYAEAIKERFKNPFIRHELTSIFLNSLSKFKARLLPILINYQKEFQKLPPLVTLSFAGLILSYRGDKIVRQDDQDLLDFFDKAWKNPQTVVQQVLGATSLWDQDLNSIPELAATLEKDLETLIAQGARTALKEKISASK